MRKARRVRDGFAGRNPALILFLAQLFSQRTIRLPFGVFLSAALL